MIDGIGRFSTMALGFVLSRVRSSCFTTVWTASRKFEVSYTGVDHWHAPAQRLRERSKASCVCVERIGNGHRRNPGGVQSKSGPSNKGTFIAPPERFGRTMGRKGSADISKIGTTVGTIPVQISYRIIDLFSGHLYSNPAKAVEELVANSYDAFAHNCHVVVPDDWDSPSASVLVWDDGESMDFDGLKELWLIADTRKRDADQECESERKGRLPVGKFGIGKLASYVLGKRITHLCKRGKEFLAVTMDYSKVVPEEAATTTVRDEPKKMSLPVRRLTQKEAESLLGFAAEGRLPGGVKLPLFGPQSPSSWTLVIVDQLKDAARRIQRGRLRWIISTALPLVPDFQVFLNGAEIEPSKLNLTVLKTWPMGKDDKAAQDLGYEAGLDTQKPPPLDTFVVIPEIGRVSGEFTLFEETLLGGKAEEIGRSYGFFIMVRRRLINHDDPLFGIHVLSHMTFNRLRAVVHADGLDKYLVASRESVSDEAKRTLRDYLTAKFNEIRGWYEDHIREREREEGIEERLAAVPGPLARFPLRHALERALHEKWTMSQAIRLPPKEKPIVDSIKSFELAVLDPTDPFAVFDAGVGTVRINTSHPFYVNYSDSPDIEALAAAEVLLEAYLYESSLSPDEVRDLLRRRDELLRAIVRERPRSVVLVAQQLRDAVQNEKDLEVSCHRAFRTLGFEVVSMGGSGKPDGLATAVLGVRYARQPGEVEERSYKITYDAKSTEHEKVKSGDLRLSTVSRHRNDWGADYAVVIAPDFETSEGEESKAVKEARQENVGLIRAKDFADLVVLSGTKPLPLDKLEELFRDCRSPDESRVWVERFRGEAASRPDLRIVLEAIHRLQQQNPTDPPSFGAIKFSENRLSSVSERQIKEWMRAFSRLLPDLINVYDDRVELNQTPQNIVAQFQQSLQEAERSLPSEGTEESASSGTG